MAPKTTDPSKSESWDLVTSEEDRARMAASCEVEGLACSTDDLEDRSSDGAPPAFSFYSVSAYSGTSSMEKKK